jgi:head-tail adaptor
MQNIAAGEFDRRIQVIQATVSKDAAGDLVFTWDPPARKFDRWAAKRDAYASEVQGAQILARQADTVWTLRWDSQSRSIAPETFRFMWRGTVFEIVGVTENKQSRMDALDFLTSSRPDLQGDRSRLLASGQP